MPNKIFIPDSALFDDQLGVVQDCSASTEALTEIDRICLKEIRSLAARASFPIGVVQQLENSFPQVYILIFRFSLYPLW
jgi:hypothetical protein